MRIGLLVASAVLVTVAACTCHGIDDLEFACEVPEDCVPGYECVDNVCRLAGTDAGDDGGEQDGGPDGGADGGDDAGCVAAPESCANGLDEDCDTLADCQDPDCDGVSCAPGAKVCVGGQCRCADGGTGATSETSCTNNTDDDCDGQVDCVDPDCAGASCGAGGRICQGGGCSCGVTDGGTGTETLCANGLDDDCDGLPDCADPNCQGRTCGTGCECVTPTPSEVTCSDGNDNDLDNAADCIDADCNGRSCGSGCVCFGGTRTETNCADGIDNDSNQGADCNDPNCTGRSCGTGCVCNGTTRVETNCNDSNSDNDGNQGADCNDPDCLGQTSCLGNCTCGPSGVRHEISCANGADDDGDGAADCADVDCPCHAYIGCTEQGCSNGADDDFCPDGDGGVYLMGDGLTDCFDGDCLGHSCGAGCVCLSTTGGTATETTCNDGADNDGDGSADCLDLDCSGRSCGGGCTCSERRRVETTCNNGLDDDGDGVSDCNDADCAGFSCGTNRVCASGGCTCAPPGGPRQATETICNDGVDNDCDGATDCNDSSCRALPCTCPETNCADGLDNDCDGNTDCADNQCLRAQCGATGASICCGTGTPSSAFCKNLSTDSANCGGCGTACTSGFTCAASGGISGRCRCSGDPNCPLGQRCQPSSNECQCRDNTECGANQFCLNPYCRY